MDAPEALREFLMYVLAHLIEHPKQASIAVGTTTSGATSYRVRLAPEDVKRVVGKNGFTISAIGSLLKVAAHKYGVRISLRVMMPTGSKNSGLQINVKEHKANFAMNC